MSITKALFRFFKQPGDSEQEQIIIRDGMIVESGSFKDYFESNSSDDLSISKNTEVAEAYRTDFAGTYTTIL